MTARELFLLTPYRLPTRNSVLLGNEEVAAFLNGWSALWHPALLHGAHSLPRIVSQYDHEQPSAGHVYAIPDSPALYLPDDWNQRVLDAGAVAFHAGPDRATTLANLKAALDGLSEHHEAVPADTQETAVPRTDLWGLAPQQVAPFFGIGFGHAHVQALCEAMDHENLLPVGEFWQNVQQAVAYLLQRDDEASRQSLKAAAAQLLAARQVLYPVTIHLLDLGLLDEARLHQPLPEGCLRGGPFNLVASGALLEKLAHSNPDQLAALRERVQKEQTEVCGGSYLERADALLPIESQLWNMRQGLSVSRQLLAREIRVYARQRFAAHPQLPQVLTTVGLHRALLVAFDEASFPAYRTTVVSWPAPGGKQLDGFVRVPFPASDPHTYFNLAYHLHQSIMQDHAATLVVLHGAQPAAPWYDDWLELSRLAPVLGQWTTLSPYFEEVLAAEQVTVSADEFQADYLSEHSGAPSDRPVSWFADHLRLRRRLDTVRALAAVQRGLAGMKDPLRLEARLAELEVRIESSMELGQELAEVHKETAETLAERLLSRSEAGSGYLVLNPCSFARRVHLELEGVTVPLPVNGPVKVCQLDGDRARLVVEVPALGFAWLPRNGPPGSTPQPVRMRLADERHIRNEFFEAEIDPATGGLRGMWDHRTRISRLGQQLVYNPGATMRAASIKVLSAGPALGEVVSEGVLVDNQEKVLASFRQSFRAWRGRPVLDLHIEITPQYHPEGYPWHAYYGARFAWRDERSLLLRGVNGTGCITSHTRPVTPDYLELRHGRESTVIFPGGMPFHQRHGARMVDVLLISPGEKARTFDLAIGLDREHPIQTALGLVTPVPWVPVSRAPPPVGASGWLFHLNAPHLLLTGLRPGPDEADAIIADLLECGLSGGASELRCVRNPKRAVLLDEHDHGVREVTVQGDAVSFEVGQGEFVRLRVDFS